MRCNFEHDFLRIFVDFGDHLGTQDGPKIKKKGIENRTDFEMMLYGGMRVIGPRNVVVEPPPGAPPYARPVNQKNNRTQDPGTKDQEPRIKS